MAQKNWKKKEGYYIWNKKNDEISLMTNYVTNTEKNYTIDIYVFETQKHNSYHVNKTFKTKAQALAFAKKYMRTH